LVLGLMGALVLPTVAEEPAPAGDPTVQLSGADIGTWYLTDRTVLDSLQMLNPAASDLRVFDNPDGSTLQPGEPLQLIYGGLTRSYVTILRYRPGGAVELMLRNEYFDKRADRRWEIDEIADTGHEGREVFLAITSRQPLDDDYLDRIAVAPHTIQLTDGILGSSYTWYQVKDQAGLRIEPGQDSTQGRPLPGGRRNPTSTQGSRGPVDESLRNPYADVGGITPTQGNPYYNPYLYGAGAYLYNPFVRQYGALPFYAPFPYGYPGYYPEAGVYRPVIDLGNAFYAPNTYFYVIPRGNRVRTNFLDLIFNADVNNSGFILRGGNDFIEGQINLDFSDGKLRPGASIRLRGVRDSRGRFFNQPPIVVIIDGTPRIPVIDPNTGDMIVPMPSMGMTPGLGNRMRIQPNVGVGPVQINEIVVE
ncbi:MAG TPA: hypothetical protein VEI97_15270, partial [bacterium]|nr:hypothetical protein [bacterium]